MNLESAKKLAQDILSGTTNPWSAPASQIAYVRAARELAEFVAQLEPGVNIIEITPEEAADTDPPQPYPPAPSVSPGCAPASQIAPGYAPASQIAPGCAPASRQETPPSAVSQFAPPPHAPLPSIPLDEPFDEDVEIDIEE